MQSLSYDNEVLQRKPSKVDEAIRMISRNVKLLERSKLEKLQKKASDLCSVKTLKKRFPVVGWLPKYNSDDAIGDFIAGITIGLTVFPQALVYAIIAGLPPIYGLYSSFIGCFLYFFLGSCEAATIGPAAVISILTNDYAYGNTDVANLLCFTSGIIMLIMAIFNLGFVVVFVSKPVISGFTTASALTIICSQLKPLFGLKYKAEGVIDVLIKFFNHVTEAKWKDMTLGIFCIVVLLCLELKNLERFKRNASDGFRERALKMAIFLISCGRNAIVVLFSATLAFILKDSHPFSLTGEIKPGLPPIQLPSFSTNNGTMGFMEMIQSTGAGVIVLPLVIILESMAIGIAFPNRDDKPFDASQEIYAVGLCNILSSFFSSMPIAASFTRSAVNASSGVRTPANGLVTGVLVILSLVILTPFCKFIPLSALAGVIICAVLCLIEYHNIIPIWKVRKIDELVLWVSFLVCLFWKLEYGILVGVAVNLMVLLYSTTNIKIEVRSGIEESNIPCYIIVEARLGLIFVNINNFKEKVCKVARGVGKGVSPVIVDCDHFTGVDYTASKGIAELLTEFQNRSQPIFFINASPTVKKALSIISPTIVIIEECELIGTLVRLNANRKTDQKMADVYRKLQNDDSSWISANF